MYKNPLTSKVKNKKELKNPFINIDKSAETADPNSPTLFLTQKVNNTII